MQKPAKNPLKIPCDKNLFGSAKNFCEYFNIKILNNTKNFLISPNKTKTFIMYLLKFTIKANGSNCVYYHENLSLNNPKNGAINTYVQHITSERKQALSFFDKEEAERLALFFQYDNYKIIKK